MAESRINNVDFSKYKIIDTVRVRGLTGDVYQENEYGELIDPISYQDASWIDESKQTNDLYSFDFEQFVLSVIANWFYGQHVKSNDVGICGDSLCFWVQEDENGYYDKDGEYFVSYALAVEINNTTVEEDDLAKLFPNFEY